MDPKTHDKRVEMASLSDVSSTTTATTHSPGRARRVSMKIKKGLKEVKEMLSPHHHHHHHHDRDQRRRKSGPNESPRGPLAPVLDHLERDKLVPIHLHISHTGSLTVSRKASSSSSRYSCSESTFEESKSEADVQPQPEVTMPTPEPYVVPSTPQPPKYGEQEQEPVPDPFLVDDPENPLSDPEPPTQEPAPSPPDSTPAESVVLSPTVPEIVLPSENVPAPPPVEDKPVPAPPPPPPVVSDTDSEPEAPTVYLPQLVLPTMFLPIPNVRISSHLTWWLTRRTSVYY
ncbi:hypothetical protein H4582DRAFT_1937879 [Lactarius indigo]|nr:hypothetical protein H4582DRAFT_1937879 [Lactarius indigo]